MNKSSALQKVLGGGDVSERRGGGLCVHPFELSKHLEAGSVDLDDKFVSGLPVE